MPPTELAPIVATIAFLGYLLSTMTLPQRSRWIVPAVLSGAFLGFSLLAVWYEGPIGFWRVHSVSLWGNQVWFDLLLAVAIAWTLILPRARAAGMRPAPWVLLVVASGCIGLLAMPARLWSLEQRA
jgi:uncharacterized membrane protein